MTDVAPGASLLDWVTGLVTDPATQARFAADPHGMLGEAGLADLDPADLHHAIPLVTDSVAARLDAVVDTSTPVPGPLAGESGLDAAVRQFTALSHRLVPLDAPEVDHPALQHDGHGLHDVPAGFDDRLDDGFDDGLDDRHHDLREVHDLDDRAHDAWSVGPQSGHTVADPARPAFATGHGSTPGGVDPDHVHDHTAPPDPAPAAADPAWHDDGPHGFAHGSPDDGDHHLDGGAQHHPDHTDDLDHTDSHHDPGAALGAS